MSDLPPADVVAAALKEPPPEPMALEPITRELVPLADAIRNTLAAIALIPIAQATPEERTALVKLREEIERIRRDSQTWVDAIDLSFRHAAVALAAKQIPLADGVVTVEPPRGEWKVDVAPLKAELVELAKAGGQVSLEEIDSMFKTVVETRADGTRLNYFARNRGAEVAEVIERHRRWQEGNPMAAKVRIQRRATDD